MIVFIKNKVLVLRRQITSQLEEWIMEVILDKADDPGHVFEMPAEIQKLLQTNIAKKVLLRELINVKKSLSGLSGVNLENIYIQQGLDQLSLKKIASKKWHIKAKGIQELAVMSQHNQHPNIVQLTNHEDMMVRMEAQNAMVRLQGYKGLQFFDHLTYPLSEWHQLYLLHLLANQPITEEDGVITWLRSSNLTVVQFSLKLIAEQHASEFHDEVVKCLSHKDEMIRREAVLCLGQMPSIAASVELNTHYASENVKNIRLCIIHEFQKTGSEKDLPFLQSLQYADDVDVKLAADKTVLYLQKNFQGF